MLVQALTSFPPTESLGLTAGATANVSPSDAVRLAGLGLVKIVDARTLNDNVSAPVPGDQALLAWAYDPAAAVNSLAGTSGTLYVVRMRLAEAATISSIVAYVGTAGATLTAAQNLAGLYDAAGVRLGVTADQSSAWTSTGTKVMALTAPVEVPAGVYWAALLAVGTTTPAFTRSAGSASASVGQTAAPYRFSIAGTGQTSMPATITPGSVTAAPVAYWVGLA
ncbi:MAG: hypothetical protein ACKVWR_00105 [Acidimicrobiales bacterium]